MVTAAHYLSTWPAIGALVAVSVLSIHLAHILTKEA